MNQEHDLKHARGDFHMSSLCYFRDLSMIIKYRHILYVFHTIHLRASDLK